MKTVHAPDAGAVPVPTRRTQPSAAPSLVGAGVLSAASLLWTGWSVSDLIGVGPIGITVAVGVDVSLGLITLAEARGVPGGTYHLRGRSINAVTALGWLMLAAVAGLLAWHGAALDGQTRHIFSSVYGPLNGAAMAVAGAFLPISARVAGILGVAALRGDSAPTASDRATLADRVRAERLASELDQVNGMTKDREHAARLREIREAGEQAAALNAARFQVVNARLEQENELRMLAPINLSVERTVREPVAELDAEPVRGLELTSAGHPLEQAVTCANPAGGEIGFGFGSTAQTRTGSDSRRSLAEIAREQVRRHPSNTDAVSAVLREMPGANLASVQATVRKARRGSHR